MSWRWLQRIRLPFGLNANLSRGGVGWSWGIGFIRWGVSPYGRKWIFIGIPGTGFRLFRYLNTVPSQQKDNSNRITQSVQSPTDDDLGLSKSSRTKPRMKSRKKYPPLRKK